MRSQLRQILQPARCHLRQIQRHQFLKRLRQQIILAIHMNIQLQEQEYQQMAVLPQIQQMFQQLLTVNNSNKPVFTLTNPTSGAAFQYSESYRGPGGVSNITSITRQIESESVVTSTSVFSQ